MCAKYGEEVFPEGSGKTKKAAKEAAAHVALQELRRGDFREQVRDALKTHRCFLMTEEALKDGNRCRIENQCVECLWRICACLFVISHKSHSSFLLKNPKFGQ